jgi:SecD/SecF fusion protein
MQNIKGAIRIFAILMALSCLFYLSFTFVTRNWEKKANAYAVNYAKQKHIDDWIKARAANNPLGEDEIRDSIIAARERFFLYDSLGGKKIYLNLYTYESCKDKELNLGLDLKGGMMVTMEVSTPDILHALSNFSTAPDFEQAIKKASAEQTAKGGDYITLFAEAYRETNPQGRLSSIFAGQLKGYDITYNSTDDQVIAAIRQEADAAVERAKLVIETRINKFGVAQPNVQHLKTTNRILVELPGVKDEDRVKKLLVTSANLEFWETYEVSEIGAQVGQANEKLTVLLGLNTDTLKFDSLAYTADYSKAKTKADSAKADTLAMALRDSARVVFDSIRVANIDTTKPQRAPLFENLVYLNQEGKGPVLLGAFTKDTATIGGYLRRPEIVSIFPRDLRFAWGVKPKLAQNDIQYFELYVLKADKRTGKPAMEGDVVTDARKQFDQQGGGGPEISMTMNAEGSLNWARLTKANIGRSVAIVLDQQVYTAPTVQNEITGGVSSITGSFTNQEADDLVNVLKTGKLPARATIVEQTVVGASLGEEAIKSGLLSFIVALIVVLIYMGLYYSKAGWVADVALLVNLFFIVGILSSLGAILTLPGIAGIILTIGLSVDANILIYERVREELRLGKALATAIQEGFRHAMSSILDSNITLLILGIILYAFGTGPVQGFATTLIIGILSSLFCAIFITRLIFDWMLKKEQKIPFSIPATENIMRNAKIDFVGKRKYYYMISAAIIVLGTVFAIKNNGFTLGVDFSGGRSYTVHFSEDVDREAVRTALAVEFGAAPEVKTAGGSNQLKITTNYRATEDDTAVDNQVRRKLETGIVKSAGAGNTYKIVSSIKVGASIANEVIYKSIIVIVISCVLMFLYILFRFRKWQYGLGSVVALLHDVAIVFSFYAIFEGIVPFSLELDQHFIAAILTVMGYTMTETVIVFDRIREYLAEAGQADLYGEQKRSLINRALNSTLGRTINTSLTIFFVLLVIFIFGGEVIRGFIFALLIGRVIGTYSSLCISTPIVVDFDRKETK